MNASHGISRGIGILVSMLAFAAAPAGCEGSKSGGPRGGAGAGVVGTTGIDGGGGASPGTGGAMTGTGGARGTGGDRGTGGAGSGGKTPLVSGSGGRGIGGGAAGTGSGGRGTGGGTPGGAGGAATGGAPGLDGGTPEAGAATCSELTTQAACEARSDCHSVFVDPGNCNCPALGCCARFQSCADGDKANCTGPVACAIVTPHCEGPYVVSIKGSCFEGCVKQTDCALPACPPAPPGNGAACGPVPVSQTCYYEDCAGAGRTVATCSVGVGAWQVTSNPCAAVVCEDPNSPSGLTCPAGKVCIITKSIGGALMTTSTCVDHTCGTGPITPECVPSLYGNCTETTSAASTIFHCELVANCGDAGCA